MQPATPDAPEAPEAPDAPEAPEAPDGTRTPRRRPAVKVAVVVQRYGADINGGAEQHARYVAEHLAKHVQVEVLTTCAHRDYISWKNELPEGREMVHGIPVHRFPVAVERDPDRVREVVGARCSRSSTRCATSWRGSTPKGRPARR